jgi:hypothetical protein
MAIDGFFGVRFAVHLVRICAPKLRFGRLTGMPVAYFRLLVTILRQKGVIVRKPAARNFV